MKNIESKLDVLVVEDEDDLLDLYLESIKDPWKKTGTTDPIRAIEYISNLNPRSAILDFFLPRMTGLQILDTSHARGIRIPILVLTTGHSDVEWDRAYGLGVSAVLMKPFNPPSLVAKITESLNADTELTQRRWLRVDTNVDAEVDGHHVRLKSLSCGGCALEFSKLTVLKNSISEIKFSTDEIKAEAIPARLVWARGNSIGFEFVNDLTKSQKTFLLRNVSGILNSQLQSLRNSQHHPQKRLQND